MDENKIKIIKNPNSISFYYHSTVSFDNYVLVFSLDGETYTLNRLTIPKYLGDELICNKILEFSLNYLKEGLGMKMGYFSSYNGYSGTIEYDIELGCYFGSFYHNHSKVNYQADSPLKLLECFRKCVNGLVNLNV